MTDSELDFGRRIRPTEEMNAPLKLPRPMDEHFLRLTMDLIALMGERGSWEIPSMPFPHKEEIETGLETLVSGWFSFCDSALAGRQLFEGTEGQFGSNYPGSGFWACSQKALGTGEAETMKILDGARRAFGKLAGQVDRMIPWDIHKAERLVGALSRQLAIEGSDQEVFNA